MMLMLTPFPILSNTPSRMTPRSDIIYRAPDQGSLGKLRLLIQIYNVQATSCGGLILADSIAVEARMVQEGHDQDVIRMMKKEWTRAVPPNTKVMSRIRSRGAKLARPFCKRH